MDFSKTRVKMVEEQIVARGIKDPRLIAAMKRVPRHLFVEEALQSQAYSDHPLPIGEKQTISQPYMVALMTETLALTGKEKVLRLEQGLDIRQPSLRNWLPRSFPLRGSGP